MWVKSITSGNDEYHVDKAFVAVIATHKVGDCEDGMIVSNMSPACSKLLGASHWRCVNDLVSWKIHSQVEASIRSWIGCGILTLAQR